MSFVPVPLANETRGESLGCGTVLPLSMRFQGLGLGVVHVTGVHEMSRASLRREARDAVEKSWSDMVEPYVAIREVSSWDTATNSHANTLIA